MKNKDDLLLSILHSPVNINNSSPQVTKDKDEEEKKSAELTEALSIEYTFGKKTENEEKYKERIKKLAEEDPTMVVIETSRGEMTLAEAMRQGYNPETEEFEKGLMPPSTEGMDPAMLQKLEQLMGNPEGVRQMPPSAMSEEEMMMQQMMGQEQAMAQEPMVGEQMIEGEAPVPTEEELMMLEQGLMQ